MADTGADVGQLSETQQTALATYTAVTNQETAAAIALLRRSQWNVQIAIAKFFDGEAPDPVEEALAAQAATPPPRPSSQREVLLNGSSSFPRSPSSSSREPAPRIVPQPENRNVYKPPLILSLLFAPVNVFLKVLSGAFGLFGYLFPFVPRLVSNLTRRNPSRSARRNTTGRRPLNPRDTAARFIREFGEEYGDHSLRFFENGYAQAYDQAKKDLKYLLVLLISPEHDDTTTFIRDTLLSPEVEAFLGDRSNNILLWAGSVQDSEAYQVSVALRCTKFPFAALVVHTPQDSATAMSTVARIAGPTPRAAFLAKLRTAMAQHTAVLDRARAQRAEQQASRDLRQEQNSAYERSLAQDRERARVRREAEAARERERAKEKARVEEREREAKRVELWKRWRAARLEPEPGPAVKDATRLSIRLTSGDRVVRKLPASASMEELYAFVECYALLGEERATDSDVKPPEGYEHEYRFKLVSPMPRAVYDLASGGTVGERIGRSGNLIVEPMIDEDE